MTYSMILPAKAAKVSGALLLAICTQETNLTNVVVYHDGSSPSYGVCQVKYDTAKMLGFKGRPNDLVNPATNAKWAASYLRYQERRYGTDNWCKLAASYNAGSYSESTKIPGKPKNLRYVKLVQNKIDDHLKHMLSCEQTRVGHNETCNILLNTLLIRCNGM